MIIQFISLLLYHIEDNFVANLRIGLPATLPPCFFGDLPLRSAKTVSCFVQADVILAFSATLLFSQKLIRSQLLMILTRTSMDENILLESLCKVIDDQVRPRSHLDV